MQYPHEQASYRPAQVKWPWRIRLTDTKAQYNTKNHESTSMLLGISIAQANNMIATINKCVNVCDGNALRYCLFHMLPNVYLQTSQMWWQSFHPVPSNHNPVCSIITKLRIILSSLLLLLIGNLRANLNPSVWNKMSSHTFRGVAYEVTKYAMFQTVLNIREETPNLSYSVNYSIININTLQSKFSEFKG